MKLTQHTSKCKPWIFLTLLLLLVIQSSSNIVISVEAGSDAELQSGDMSILAEVELTNISLFTLEDVSSSKFLSTQMRIVSSSSQDLLFSHFLSSMKNFYISALNSITNHMKASEFVMFQNLGNNFPVYSMHQSSFTKLDLLPNKIVQNILHLKEIGQKPFFMGNLNNESTNITNSGFDSLITDLGITKEDFKAIGFETVEEERLSTSDVLASGERTYENISEISLSEVINPKYVNFATQIKLIDPNEFEFSKELMRTEDLVGETSQTHKYTILSSGYTNFEQEAIIDPILDWYVDEEASNGILVDKSSLAVEYDRVDNTNVQQFMSETLQRQVMSPIDEELEDQEDDDWIDFNIQSTFYIAGIPIATKITQVQEGDERFIFNKKPLLRLNSFRALSRGTTSAVKSGISQNIQYQNYVRDMTSSGLGCAMSPSTSISGYSGFSKIGCSGISPIHRELRSNSDPNKVTNSAVVQDTILKRTSLAQTIMGIAPFAVLGFGIFILLIFLFKKKTPGI